MIEHSPILRTVARFTVPLTVAMSVVVFMQGHNLPGGGFIAGVLAAAAGATYLLAFGVVRASKFSWWRLSVIGLLIALVTGVVLGFVGVNFMDHTAIEWVVPGIHYHLHLPTATFFDLGVYLIVFGTLMTVFVELGLEGR